MIRCRTYHETAAPFAQVLERRKYWHRNIGRLATASLALSADVVFNLATGSRQPSLNPVPHRRLTKPNFVSMHGLLSTAFCLVVLGRKRKVWRWRKDHVVKHLCLVSDTRASVFRRQRFHPMSPPVSSPWYIPAVGYLGPRAREGDWQGNIRCLWSGGGYMAVCGTGWINSSSACTSWSFHYIAVAWSRYWTIKVDYI